MGLFEQKEPRQLLAKDGDVLYFGSMLTSARADAWLESLLDDPNWAHDELVMFGKKITTARKVIWYGDAGQSYHYSGATKQAQPWSALMLEIKDWVEQQTGECFNSCLLNLYHHGDEGMGWHSDDEAELGPEPVIAALSLGAERRMRFRHKSTKETTAVDLEHGSLLVMRGKTQACWQHCITKTKKVSTPRVSLTFRQMRI
jgi:alkylated DNA repair dioxygenase AlkB